MVGTFKGRNKPSCIYAWTHMKKEKERKISKDGERNGKKKAMKLLHCYGILRKRGGTRGWHYFCKHNHAWVMVKLCFVKAAKRAIHTVILAYIYYK
jgi:hypothetical protein